MMKYNEFNKVIRIIVPFLFWGGYTQAQIGLGIPDPINPVEIKTDAGKVIVDKNGKLGVLVSNPKVAVDLRSGTNGAIAIGNTNKTAVQAGAGALRYVASPAIGVKGYLEFSDGTNWVSFFRKESLVSWSWPIRTVRIRMYLKVQHLQKLVPNQVLYKEDPPI